MFKNFSPARYIPLLSLSLSVSLSLIPGLVRADDLSDGKALYKAGKFSESATKLEAAAKANPKDAQIWWQLNFTYHKLKKDQDALTAVKKAGDLDPKHDFASESGKYEQILKDREKSAGGTPKPITSNESPNPVASGQGETTDGSGSGNLTEQLVNGDVYVERGIRVDVERLRTVSKEMRPTVVKFVVFNRRLTSRQLAVEGDRVLKFLKSYLNGGDGYVVLASRSAVTVASQGLNKNTLKDLTEQVAPQMSAGQYTLGLERLAKGLVTTRSSTRTSTTGFATDIPHPRNSGIGRFIVPIIVILVVLIIVWAIWNSNAKARAVADQKGPVERQKGEVISQLNFLDDQIRIADPAVGARAREGRVSAGTHVDQAARILSHAKSVDEINEAASLLGQAEREIARARAILAGPAPAPSASGGAAPTGTGMPPKYSDAQTDWSTVDNTERGVCFFCSKPTYLNELTPVTVNLNGQQQKVLACADDLNTVKTGAVPNIRAFNQNGQSVPWYATQNYNPYTDYYGRYSGGSFLADMVALSVVDSMFWGWHRPMGWGWGGGYGYGGYNNYVFYADNPVYHDYYSSNAGAYGGGGGYGDYAGNSGYDRSPSDAAGTDFLSDTSGDTGYGGSNVGSSNMGRDHS